MNQIKLISYTPGALGRITELHGTYYAQHWGLGLYFEAKVATELGEFLNSFNPEQDGAWFAEVDSEIRGGIFIVGPTGLQGARLRWFIIDENYHGIGLGKQLMSAAMDFCRAKGFERVYLTTFAGLTAARHLYEKHGFRLIGEEDATELTGNSELTEQIFEWLPG